MQKLPFLPRSRSNPTKSSTSSWMLKTESRKFQKADFWCLFPRSARLSSSLKLFPSRRQWFVAEKISTSNRKTICQSKSGQVHCASLCDLSTRSSDQTSNTAISQRTLKTLLCLYGFFPHSELDVYVGEKPQQNTHYVPVSELTSVITRTPITRAQL